jgi:general secretion pathway protein F
LYINLVRLGEAGGKLPAVFRELAKDLAFRKDLKQKIISAAVYPMVVLMVCVLSVVFILNFVVPSLEGLFADASSIPWYTELLLDTSRFFRQWQWALVLAVVLAAVLAWRYRRSPSLVDQREKLLISTPGLRDALLMVERIRFAGGLSMMLEAGMPIDRALGLSADNVGNSILRKQLKSAIAFVKRGEQVSSSLRKTKLFPDYFASLLEVGEETGQLASSLSNIAERTRSEFAAWALRLTTLLEPLLILVMGLIVGGVVVIMMLSITSIGDVGL